MSHRCTDEESPNSDPTMDISAETPTEIASPPDSSVNSPCSADDLGEPTPTPPPSLQPSSHPKAVTTNNAAADAAAMMDSTTPVSAIRLDNRLAHTSSPEAGSTATTISPSATNTNTLPTQTPTRTGSQLMMNTSLSMLTLSNDSHPLMFADESANRNNDYDDNDADFADVDQNNARLPVRHQTPAPDLITSCSSSSASGSGRPASQPSASPRIASAALNSSIPTGARPRLTRPLGQSASSSPSSQYGTPPAPAVDYETSVNADQQSVSLHSSRPAAANTPPAAMPALRRIPVDAALLSDNDDDCSSIDTSSPHHSFDEDLDDDLNDEEADDTSTALRSRSTISITSSVLNEAAGAMAASGSSRRPATENSRLVPPARDAGNVSPIPQYLAADEARDTRHWRRVTLANGEQREIDMRVIEPYQRVLSHGGYLSTGGRNAIVVFSACHLPEKSRRDYQYVMNNLFLYVVKTLEQLITDDYVLVYLHGAASRTNAPTFAWLKSCYQLLDRRLRKSMRTLYIVHPSMWLKSMVLLMRPFISRKFWRKLVYVKALEELYTWVPVERAAIPEKVKRYDDKYA